MRWRSCGGAAQWTVGLAVVVWAGTTGAEPLLTIGVDGVTLRDGERVVGFDVTVTSGRIAALPAVPIGWAVTVENYPSWRTQATGAILIGAAALELAFFRDFLVVDAHAPPGPAFGVDVVLVVTADFQHRRRLRVPAAQLRIHPRRSD